MTSTPPAQSALLNVTEVANLLGISPRHVWRMADAGTFPRPLKVGMKLRRWPRSSVESWLAEQTAVANRR